MSWRVTKQFISAGFVAGILTVTLSSFADEPASTPAKEASFCTDPYQFVCGNLTHAQWVQLYSKSYYQFVDRVLKPIFKNRFGKEDKSPFEHLANAASDPVAQQDLVNVLKDVESLIPLPNEEDYKATQAREVQAIEARNDLSQAEKSILESKLKLPKLRLPSEVAQLNPSGFLDRCLPDFHGTTSFSAHSPDPHSPYHYVTFCPVSIFFSLSRRGYELGADGKWTLGSKTVSLDEIKQAVKSVINNDALHEDHEIAHAIGPNYLPVEAGKSVPTIYQKLQECYLKDLEFDEISLDQLSEITSDLWALRSKAMEWQNLSPSEVGERIRSRFQNFCYTGSDDVHMSSYQRMNFTISTDPGLLKLMKCSEAPNRNISCTLEGPVQFHGDPSASAGSSKGAPSSASESGASSAHP